MLSCACCCAVGGAVGGAGVWGDRQLAPTAVSTTAAAAVVEAGPLNGHQMIFGLWK